MGEGLCQRGGYGRGALSKREIKKRGFVKEEQKRRRAEAQLTSGLLDL